jgi:hypothetical protein
VGEDLKEMDWVPQFSESGIDVEVETEKDFQRSQVRSTALAREATIPRRAAA